MSRIKDLNKLGQSVWLDFIRRSLITSGEMEALIERGVSGITSNPTIFEKAIAGSSDYDEALRELVDEGKTNDEIYQALALDDIRRAADLFRPVWNATGGADGYVSLEANPKLAYDTEGTIAEARMLFKALDRPNVMIKVPATAEGIPAIENLIASGVNVNVTLIFSLAHYEAVVRAYIAGLEKLAARGGNLRKVASVASFFVSRLDTALDRLAAYHWLIFTSANGVAFFFRRLRERGGDVRDLKGIRIATIGPATAAAVEARGVRVPGAARRPVRLASRPAFVHHSRRERRSEGPLRHPEGGGADRRDDRGGRRRSPRRVPARGDAHRHDRQPVGSRVRLRGLRAEPVVYGR